MALVFATWPIYTLAWLMALLRIPLGFRPTPKTASGGLNPVWLLPQFVSSFFLVVGILYHFFFYEGPLQSLVLGFALAQTAPQLLFFLHCLSGMVIVHAKNFMMANRSTVDLG